MSNRPDQLTNVNAHDPITSREVVLAARPAGEPGPENFELVESVVPPIGEDQVLVRNSWMSVDPYMRGRMNDAESVIPPFQIGTALEGGAIGEVVASTSPALPVGTTVTHFLGWREYAVLDASAASPVDTTVAPPEAYLGALGLTGLTAYAALTDVAPVREGDVVFISAAAGAVGSVGGQIARVLGASKVIGSAGGPEKTKRIVTDFGFDAAIDYHAGSVQARLREAAPEGIDVYLDNVGGEQLDVALGELRVGGRVALVGAISGYNATEPGPAPSNFHRAHPMRLSLRGMLVNDYFHLLPEYVGKAAGWLADGTLRSEETVFDGIENAPDAFLGVMRGANVGKMLVRL